MLTISFSAYVYHVYHVYKNNFDGLFISRYLQVNLHLPTSHKKTFKGSNIQMYHKKLAILYFIQSTMHTYNILDLSIL